MPGLPTDHGLPQLLTLEEAAKQLGMSDDTLRRFLRRREKEIGTSILTNIRPTPTGKPVLRVTKHGLFAAAQEWFPSRSELEGRVDKCERRLDDVEKVVDVLSNDFANRRRRTG